MHAESGKQEEQNGKGNRNGRSGRGGGTTGDMSAATRGLLPGIVECPWTVENDIDPLDAGYIITDCEPISIKKPGPL
jgi:hypothetical protein